MTEVFNPRELKEDSFDHLVYLRIFEGCNLYCDHCFIPNNPKKMTPEQFLNIPDRIRQFAKEDSNILFQWHGGEPTALGPEYLEKCIQNLDLNTKEMKFQHGIQTNLITYNNDWKRIYEKYFGGVVGVSWDYDIRKVRPSMSNKEYEKIFWGKLDQLVSDGLTPYMVITSTRKFFERYRNPFELFEMLEAHGVYRLHIERLTETGEARTNWSEIGIDNKYYSENMSRIYKAYKHYVEKNKHRKTIHISPFDGIDESVNRLIRGETGGYGCLSGACDSKYHTFDANGYKFGCTALNSEQDNKRVASDVQIIQISDFSSTRNERKKTCEGCEFTTICSSGCLATNKFDESGECSGSKKLFEISYKYNS